MLRQGPSNRDYAVEDGTTKTNGTLCSFEHKQCVARYRDSYYEEAISMAYRKTAVTPLH